jgi:uncharacterized damage-inducible protein DinB
VRPEQARMMASYNQWMNERLYGVCAELADVERKQHRGAFFRSIHGTLNHLLLGDKIWLGRFAGQPFLATSLDQELFPDFETLRAERARTDGEITAWAATLTDETLKSTLRYTSLMNPAPRSYSLWVVVTHFFNHQTHHSGQLTTLLSQAGKDYGITDLIWLADLERD